MRRKASDLGRGKLRWLGVALALAALAGAAAAAGALGGTKAAAITPPPSSSCHLANGISHVIEITFDNTHFNRDNPNVLSDLEQMPALHGLHHPERDAALEQLHAADRAHGRRQPDELHRAVRRPARPGDRQQLRDLRRRNPHIEVVVRLLDGDVQPGLVPEHAVLAEGPRGGLAGEDAAGSVGSVHARRL